MSDLTQTFARPVGDALGSTTAPASTPSAAVPWDNIPGTRRAGTERLRILHAPNFVTPQQWTLSRAQRNAGHRSDLFVFNAAVGYPTVKCDFDLGFSRDMVSLRPARLLPSLGFLCRFAWFFLLALMRYDVFHFHSESFFGSYSDWDLKILRLFRKTIVFQYWGFDVKLQTPALLSERYGAVKRDIRFYANSRKLRDNLMHLRYADFRVYSGVEVIRNVPDAMFIPIAIDVECWRPVEEIPQEHRLAPSRCVRILHPFQTWDTRGDWKGTSVLRASVEALKAEGHAVELVFVDRVPHDAMRYYYQQADIVVEQLLSGFHGNVSVEAMAMGKPAVCYLNEDAYQLLPPGNPIVNANPDTLTDRLRDLVTDPEVRQRVGHRGRAYIEHYYDAMKIAKVYLELYTRKWR